MKDWTIHSVLEWTTQHLKGKGVESPRLDSELLLTEVLGCKRLDLYLRFDQPLKEAELQSYKELVVRRSRREPVAYILGRQDFYGRPFTVGPGVLIPRPETELLVEAALKTLKEFEIEKISVLDAGAGSGAIGVSLALEDTRVIVTAIDSSPHALVLSKKNALDLQVESRIRFVEQDFKVFESLDKFDVVVSNPPYVAKMATLSPDVREYEPAVALFGGDRGSETLDWWIPKLWENLKEGGALFCEIGFDQKEHVEALAQGLPGLENVDFVKDYNGHHRVLRATKRKRDPTHG